MISFSLIVTVVRCRFRNFRNGAAGHYLVCTQSISLTHDIPVEHCRTLMAQWFFFNLHMFAAIIARPVAELVAVSYRDFKDCHLEKQVAARWVRHHEAKTSKRSGFDVILVGSQSDYTDLQGLGCFCCKICEYESC